MNVLRTATRKTISLSSPSIRPSQSPPILLPRMSSSSSQNPIRFGAFEVTEQVFLTTPHSFALVNLKPLLPGHVLVCPTAQHKRLTDLSPPELTDLFQAVQRVERMLARHYFSPSSPSQEKATGPEAGSFNIALQDGPEAGQTVSHVHVHVIPRIRGATAKAGSPGGGDELYVRMAGEEGNVGGALWDRERPRPGGGFPSIEDADRRPRGMEEMAEEARVYRRVLEEMEREEGGKKQAKEVEVGSPEWWSQRLPKAAPEPF